MVSKNLLMNECYKNCPWVKWLAFVEPKGLLTFPEFFSATIEGCMKRDEEIRKLRREVEQLRRKQK